MITSSANARIKQVVQWQTKAKERKKSGIFLVEGIKMFEEAPLDSILEVYISEELFEKMEKQSGDKQTIIYKKKLEQTGYEIVAKDVFLKMSDTQTPQGILSVLKRPEYDLDALLQKENPIFVILENLQDPGNLGTIVRTGEGAGITGVIMSSQTVDIYNPKTIRATMGSVYRVPFVYVEDLSDTLSKLKAKGIHTFAAHLKGSDYYQNQAFTEPCAFLIGNEGNGLTDEIANLAEKYIKIPMEGQVESLNAAIATSLLMYEAHRQRHL